jgi:N-acetylmuramoyl-L-alanine amidase
MPTTISVTNRYIGEPVAGAAVTFDQDQVDAQTPRTRPNGLVTIPTETLSDGAHTLHIIPANSTTDPVGPAVAETLGNNVTAVFRPLDIDIRIQKGAVQSPSVSAGQALNGSVGAGTNPVRVQLQPVYYRSSNQNPNNRKYTDITLIVIHQTAGANNIAGTLSWFANSKSQVSAHYVISGEATPQIVKVVQDTGRSWHAGHDAFWDGKPKANGFSIGIELSHKTGTPWPPKQIDALLAFLDVLLKAYPTIKRDHIVGHMDVLTDAAGVLTGRDCPGWDFDWTLLESRGFGLVPKSGPRDIDAYGRFFRLASSPHDSFRINDKDSSRRWGGRSWPAPTPSPAPTPGGPSQQPLQQDAGTIQTVTGTPIRELQTDLRDIGYSVDVDGNYTQKTEAAVKMFQQHFFSGPRRAEIKDGERGKVGATTAEWIKRIG